MWEVLGLKVEGSESNEYGYDKDNKPYERNSGQI